MSPTVHVGAANFGSAYGISSKEKLPNSELHEILNYAAKNFMIVDTAEDYPNSHQLIGSEKRKLRIATKIDIRRYKDSREVSQAIRRAKADLKTDTLELLYFRGGDFLQETNEKLKIHSVIGEQEELGIKELGFSIYEKHEVDLVDSLFGSNFTFQVPFNLGNTNFQEVIEEHNKRRSQARFVARSIFLQGLLTIPQEEIPAKLTPIMPLREWLQRTSLNYHCSEVNICLTFVAKSNLFQAMVIGIQTLRQLEECKTFIDTPENCCDLEFGDLPSVPNSVLDPRCWNNL